jgi:hypothetical protein
LTLENFTSSVGYEVKIFASAEAFLDSDAPLQTGLRGFGLVAAPDSLYDAKSSSRAIAARKVVRFS